MWLVRAALAALSFQLGANVIHKNRKGGVRGHWVVTPAGLDTISLPCFMSEMIRRSYCNSFNFDPLPSRLLLIIVYQYKQSSRCYHCITPDLATLQPATCPYYTIRSNPTLSGHFTVIFASCSTCWMVFQFVAVGRSVSVGWLVLSIIVIIMVTLRWRQTYQFIWLSIFWPQNLTTWVISFAPR